MENQKNQTTEHRLYLLDKNFKNSINLIKYIDEAQNFYNGNQYPNTNYNNMIRVTLNICSFSANIKASKICGTPIYLSFTADKQDVDCNALRRFDEYNCNKMHLKTNNFQAALNGFVNGTEITYIRWDEDDTTYKGIYKGGLVEEHLDIRNCAVANPYIQDIQNQAWVMYWNNVPVGALKELVEGATPKIKKEKCALIEKEITGDEEDEYVKKEYINNAMCRLYTRFFRVDGEVYFMCSTESVDIFEYPHPLSRKVASNVIKKVVDEYKNKLKNDLLEENSDTQILDYKIDYEDLIMNAIENKAFSDENYKKVKEKFSLYPFAVFRPFVQNRSFYGRSDIKGLIPIQKGLNFALSMNLKCAENNAYNKIFAKPDALKGQKITNEPGQVIIDYSGFTNQWGIKMAESQPMPNGLLDFTDRLLGMTRIIYGFNDIMDGSVSNQDLSGYAVQLMMKQANTSIEQQQQLFWLFNEEKAAIRLMYYKHYVDKARYTYQLSDAEYDGEEQSREKIYNYLLSGRKLKTMPDATPDDFKEPTHKTKVEMITNDDLYGINFDICIDSMQGLSDSKLAEQQMWDNLLLNGGIQNIQPEILELYLQASPNVSERTKTELKNVIENLKQGKIRDLESKLNELSSYTQQIINYARQLEAQNGQQSNYIKNLTAEFTNKINNANVINEALMKDLDKVRKPSQKVNGQVVSEGEGKSNNARGISGVDIA